MTEANQYAAPPGTPSAFCRFLARKAAFIMATAAALSIALATTARAHSFSLAVIAGGEHAAKQLGSAIKGMLLATAERDSHAEETSDGHLGGLDVHIVPMPADAASTVSGLKNVPQDTIDIAVVLGRDARAKQAVAALSSVTVVMTAGTISPGQADAETTFAQRFETAYGTQPDLAAAQGYNAARRVDLAVRKLGGVNDRSALAAALAVTENGIDW